ncbi:hypothetical protein [Tateyamaria sp. ANG-S1]|uniref:hypothetical protein n=1 Tax=Tateyamaria sp. ANG-S1 TaxID=1577905 RepID=UPI00057CDB30|nr:hypothetical protein [Tateyamaria sp. ANG-S1]KIC50462.1 hypothetical protein RA29_07120 [Tateyamaria sp. ANG-S1]
MKDHAPSPVPLRPPETVMRLSRMGQMMPTRLSFLRVLVRRLCTERASVLRSVWDMSPDGYGQAVYSISLGDHTYSLVAISSHLPDDQRSDRVIATAWDAAFVLFDGVPGPNDLDRIATQAPKQEAGRFGPRDLVLSRANKSMRMWDATVAALQSGQQPDPRMIRDIGYLMRTTAVYGNGKFGIADRNLIADRPGLDGPFAAEMLTVYLIRHFTLDLVQHVGGAALDPRLARHIGIGNATGLGMAPFLVNHPVLLHNWMQARETALARVIGRAAITDEQINRLQDLARRARAHLADWHVPAEEHNAVLRHLEADWDRFLDHFDAPASFASLWHAAQSETASLQELLAALLLEVCPEDVDDLAADMGDPFGALVAPFRDTDAVKAAISSDWAWALGLDYSAAEHCGRFWYVSAAKLEPRLGDRFTEPGAELESPLDTARRVAKLYADLPEQSEPVSAFTATHPEHVHAIARVALLACYPYAEIRDNLIAATCRPIDMLRCKLSFFGATKFDPKSDLWTRITLAQGAPLANELRPEMDDWWLPVMER